MNTTPLPDDAELEALLRESAQMEDAPSHVLYRAEALGAPRAAVPPARPWQRLLASLSFDSGGASGLALGLRGDQAGGRQWLFTAGDHDFDLRCEAADDSPGAPWQLAGQVLGPQDAGEVQLFDGAADPAEGARPQREATLGELGDFRWEGLAAGACRLVFLLGEQRIELPAIELGGDTPP